MVLGPGQALARHGAIPQGGTVPAGGDTRVSLQFKTSVDVNLTEEEVALALLPLVTPPTNGPTSQQTAQWLAPHAGPRVHCGVAPRGWQGTAVEPGAAGMRCYDSLRLHPNPTSCKERPIAREA